MDLTASPEQGAITTAARALLASTRRRRHWSEEDGVVDPETWGRYAAQGWFGLGLPEEAGGVGYGAAEEALLFVEIGRALPTGPFLATVLGARVAVAARLEGEAVAIMAGARRVGLAQAVVPASAGGRSPTRHVVYDGREADLLVVVDPLGAWLHDATRSSTRHRTDCIDAAVPLGEVELSAGDAIAHVPPERDATFRLGLVLAAATLAGMASGSAEMAVAHAAEREQFGRPIGVHQAIKHRCADMSIAAEAAVAQVLYAAISHHGGRPDAQFQAIAAKVTATAAAERNAAGNVQVHGGSGFTYELDAQRYVTRALVLDQVLGPRRRLMADLLREPDPLLEI